MTLNKKTFIIAFFILTIPVFIYAGFNFGFIKAVKKKVKQVDEKVELKQNEILASHATTLSWTGETNYIYGERNAENIYPGFNPICPSN